jgi:dUTPase
VLGGVIDPDYHGEIGLPLHNGGKQDYVWSVGDPLRASLSPGWQ